VEVNGESRLTWDVGHAGDPAVVVSPALPVDFTQLRVIARTLRRQYGQRIHTRTLARAIASTGWNIWVARVHSSTIVAFAVVESVWRGEGHARLCGFWVHPKVKGGLARYLLQLVRRELPTVGMVARFRADDPAAKHLTENGWFDGGATDDGRNIYGARALVRAGRNLGRREPAEAREEGGAPRSPTAGR
jgi:hypothetical protein